MPGVVGIIGLGAVGSMTALELARRGRRVVGFDRFRPPHGFGSSHGKTRIIREAYFEHPQYVPLVQRAYQRWVALEESGAAPLYLPTGGLMIGLPDGALVAGARRSAAEHGLEYQVLSAAEVGRRFPMFHLAGGEVGLLEPRAGVLFPEAAVRTALTLANRAGARLHYDEPVGEWSPGPAITVRTPGASYEVDHLVVAAGAWMATGLPRMPLPLAVTRQTLFWFDPQPSGRADDFGPGRMPVFIWEWQPGRMFYGFPDLGDGVKVAIHHEGEPADPMLERRAAAPGDAAPLLEALAGRIPLIGSVRESAVCLYTNTRSGDFLLDRHPADPRVILASPCSGHGFKFAPALGEVIADLVEERAPRFDLTPFRLERFLRSA